MPPTVSENVPESVSENVPENVPEKVPENVHDIEAPHYTGLMWSYWGQKSNKICVD